MVVVTLFSDVRHADGGPFCRQIFPASGVRRRRPNWNRHPDRHRVVVFHLLFKVIKRVRRLSSPKITSSRPPRRTGSASTTFSLVRLSGILAETGPLRSLGTGKGAVRQQTATVAEGNTATAKQRFIQPKVEKAPGDTNAARPPLTNVVEEVTFCPLKNGGDAGTCPRSRRPFCFRHDDLFPCYEGRYWLMTRIPFTSRKTLAGVHLRTISELVNRVFAGNRQRK